VSGTTYTTSIPTLTQYNYINSVSGATPQQLVNQGNGTTGMTVDPVALNMLRLFPAPNVGTAGRLATTTPSAPTKRSSPISTTFASTTTSTRTTIFSPLQLQQGQDLHSCCYSGGANTNAPAALKAIIPGGGRWNFAGPATDGGQQIALGFTHTFTQNLLVDLRAGFTRINNFSQPLNYNNNADTR